MPERPAFGEIVRADPPVTVGSVTLLPIARIVVHAIGTTPAWVAASKEPFALVVRDAGGIRALDANARPIPLEELRAKVPGLDALIGSI